MSIVRERFDNSETGATIDTGGCPIVVIPRFGVPKVRKTVLTDRGIGRNTPATAITALGFDDFERLEHRLRGMLAVNCDRCNTGKRWRVVLDISQESVDSVGLSFGFDAHAGISKISDGPMEPMGNRPSVNERSEPDALDDAVHPDRRPLHTESNSGHTFNPC